MSLRPALDPIKNGMITVPGGHQFTLTGFHWAGMPTVEEFAQIKGFAGMIDRANEWSQADLICMEVKLALKADRTQRVNDLVAAFALARGESVQAWYRRYNVGEFYPWSARVSGLYFTHHRDVWAAGVGSLTKAKEWLKRALDGGWDVARLRCELMASTKGKRHANPELPIIFPKEFQEACGWASARLEEVDDMPIDLLRERIERLEPLIQYTDRARARLSAAPGRESIKASG